MQRHYYTFLRRATVMLVLIFTALSTNLAAPDAAYYFDEHTVTERLNRLQHTCFKPKYTRVVGSYLRTYFMLKRDKAENIIGRSVVYFPMIEQKLRDAGMPEAIKYLPVVESALNPNAVSRSGAVGLWQFMPATGREYGLRINKQVDDRRNPEMATDAAIRYLQRAYARYKSWPLALAAYNGGGGRVARAVKRSRSRNFWTLRKYLPRETRNYVPAFIAASYLMEYYREHDITPRYPSLDHQLHEKVILNRPLSFYTIAQVTGISISVIQDLNPSYLSKYIPSSSEGYTLILPTRAVPALKEYVEFSKKGEVGPLSVPVYQDQDIQRINASYFVEEYTAEQGETLRQVANRFKVSPHHLIAWNNLQQTQLTTGQRMKVYRSSKPVVFSPRPTLRKTNPIATLPLSAEVATEIESRISRPDLDSGSIWEETFTRDDKVFYLVKKSVTLAELADEHSLLNLDQLRDCNPGLKARRKLNVGTLLVLMEKPSTK